MQLQRAVEQRGERVAAAAVLGAEQLAQVAQPRAGFRFDAVEAPGDGVRRDRRRGDSRLERAELALARGDQLDDLFGLVVGLELAERSDEPRDVGAQLRGLGLQRRVVDRHRRRLLFEALSHLVDHELDKRLAQHLALDPADKRVVDRGHGSERTLGAGLRATGAVVLAAVGLHRLAAAAAVEHRDRTAALATASEPPEQVLRLGAAQRCAAVQLHAADAAVLDGALQLLGDDAQRGQLGRDPRRRRSLHVDAGAAAVLRAAAPPHEAPEIAFVEKDGAHARAIPSAGAAAARARRGYALVVEQLRDRAVAIAAGVEREDPAHDVGLALVDRVLGAQLAAAAVFVLEDADVPIPEAAAAGVVAGRGLALQRLARAACDRTALRLAAPAVERRRDLPCLVVGADLAIVEVVEEPAAAVVQRLDREPAAERVAGEPVVIAAHDDIKLARARALEQLEQSRSLLKLAAREAAVGDHADDEPPARFAVGASSGLLRLERVGLVLFGGLAKVQADSGGSRHRRSSSRPAGTSSRTSKSTNRRNR